MSSKLAASLVFCFISLTMISAFVEGETAFATSKLETTLTPTATTVVVNSTRGFDADDNYIYIEDEIIYYTSTGTNTFNGCTRAQKDTEAASHSAWTSEAPTKVYSKESDLLNRVIEPLIGDFGTEIPFFNITIPIPDPVAFIKGFARMIMWDYSFLAGILAIIKYIILYPLSAAFLYGLISLSMDLAKAMGQLLPW